MKRYLDIKEFETDKTIHSIDVTGKSERAIEKIMLGILRQMDRDNFYIDDSGTIEKKVKI